MNGTVYKVVDWSGRYEKAQSRKCVKMNWVAFPNTHDGNGYGRVAAHEKASDLFTAFILICQVASKMEERGLLIVKGIPLTAEDIAFKTRFPKAIFELAFLELVKPGIGWLEIVE